MAATEAGNEEMQLQIEEKLMGMNTVGLSAFAHILNIPQDQWKDKSRYTIVTVIRKYVEGGTDDDDNRLMGRKVFLAKVWDILKDQQKEPKEEPGAEGGAAVPGDQTITLLKSLTNGGSVLRRDLKFVGQIGEPNQKDKLSFVGVHNQIKEAEGRGYTNKEIISACIRAMTPSLPLRKFLEATSFEVITLPLLKKYLRAHFHEKSAQELYGELDKLTQQKGEDAMSFLFRAFKLAFVV